MCQCQFSFLLDKKKKSTEFLFYLTSSPHKKPGEYVNFDLRVNGIFSKLFCKLHLKETFNEWWHFKLHLIFQLIY